MAPRRRVALVTCGAKGIGRAIAKHLPAGGWRVSVVDQAGSGLRRAFGQSRDVVPVDRDVADEDAVQRSSIRFWAHSDASTDWCRMPAS